MRFFQMKRYIVTLVVLTGLAAPISRAGMVLAFDDGYANWTEIIAPELARVGGKATAYVNNIKLNDKGLAVERLRELSDHYGWEVATHTYHHYDAPRFVQRKGMDAWVEEELQRSVDELRELGFKPTSLAFPFNSFNEPLRRAALEYVSSVRRTEALPLMSARRPDGTIPSAAIDLSAYVPTELLRQWIDLAAEQNQHIFLFGHKVLPDSQFGNPVVQSVSTYTLTADRPINVQVEQGYGQETCLVPDTAHRMSDVLKVRKIEGDTVYAGRGDLRRYTSVGSRFLVGPCYGTPFSEFRSMIDYAAERMDFLTVSEALSR